MTPARRRRLLVIAGVVLVLVLVGGRWLAVETAERAWAATLARGDVYLDTRNVIRLLQLAVLVYALAWGVANFYFVYRAIGSVQMPRRIGDLVIVEAVPPRMLRWFALASGLLYGVGLAWAAGSVWREALIAGAAPHFGVTDPILHRDLGYYVATLPWADTRDGLVLLFAGTALLIVGTLYAGMGSLRVHAGRLRVSAHARAHLGIILACLAVAMLWGALLDPAEVVAGLHGVVDQAAVRGRLPGADVVAGVSSVALAASVVWIWWDRVALVAAAWGLCGAAAAGVYWIVPAAMRSGAAAPDTAYAAPRAALERAAFGADVRDTMLGAASPAAALAALPLWDGHRAGRDAPEVLAPPAAAALAGRGAWIVAGRPVVRPGTPAAPVSWAAVHTGPAARAAAPLLARETDSTLEFAPSGVTATQWVGPGFLDFALVGPADPPTPGGIPLDGLWRRIALAWALQSPELVSAADSRLRVLWRRDVGDRLARLAPYADFEAPVPVAVGDTLWWAAWGYVSAETFPLARPLPFGGTAVRYARAAVLGVVNATTADTRLYLVPGADSLAAAWARLFAPLVEPADSLPGDLARALPVPRDGFDVAATAFVRATADSGGWVPRPATPFDLWAERPGWSPGPWRAITYARSPEGALAGVLAGTMTPDGPRLYFARPPAGESLPGPVLGSGATRPGVFRAWLAAGAPVTSQALFREPASGAGERLDAVYVSWGARNGAGPTAEVALRDLFAARPVPVDTTAASVVAAARRLVAALDSALAAQDLERFGRLFGQLKALLGARGRGVARPAPRR